MTNQTEITKTERAFLEKHTEIPFEHLSYEEAHIAERLLWNNYYYIDERHLGHGQTIHVYVITDKGLKVFEDERK